MPRRSATMRTGGRRCDRADRRNCGRRRHRLQGARADGRRVALLREGGTLRRASSGRRRTGSAGAARAQAAPARDGQRAADLARAEARRALVDGQHRRLSGGHRGGARVRALHRLITAAGKVPPAKVFVIGAGVAGLRRSARVAAGRHRARERHAARGRRPDQVARRRSVRAVDDEGRRRRRLRQGDERGLPEGAARRVREAGKDVDIIITTALIPGKPAPKLITETW